MSAEDVRTYGLDAWGYLAAAVADALGGSTLDSAEKTALANDWDTLESIFKGANPSDADAVGAALAVFDYAFTGWLTAMKATAFPGADGSAPAHMCATYDQLADYLGRPLCATL